MKKIKDISEATIIRDAINKNLITITDLVGAIFPDNTFRKAIPAKFMFVIFVKDKTKYYSQHYNTKEDLFFAMYDVVKIHGKENITHIKIEEV